MFDEAAIKLLKAQPTADIKRVLENAQEALADPSLVSLRALADDMSRKARRIITVEDIVGKVERMNAEIKKILIARGCR